MKNFATYACVLLLLAALPPEVRAQGEWACPEALRQPAMDKRVELQRIEHQVRDSSSGNPFRVEPTEIFDLSAHECHSGQTQAWRVFGVPYCSGPTDGGLYKVVYPYDLFYRRATEEAAMFKEDWKPGSDGIWQVTFEKKGEVWSAVGQRELLELTPRKGHTPKP